MGTWGPGGFENDAALDAVAEFATSEDLAALFDSLPEDADEPVDADKAQTVVAAAECVAALLGRPAGDLPDALAATLKGFGPPEPELVETAREALSGVLSWSELAELWAEDDPAPFNLAITSLIDRLNPDLPFDPPATGSQSEVLQICSFCGDEIAPAALVAIEINQVSDSINTLNRGFWAHFNCLNARLHPRHMIQNWKFDPDETARAAERLLKG